MYQPQSHPSFLTVLLIWEGKISSNKMRKSKRKQFMKYASKFYSRRSKNFFLLNFWDIDATLYSGNNDSGRVVRGFMNVIFSFLKACVLDESRTEKEKISMYNSRGFNVTGV
jgi:hypothetical protein